MKTGSILIEYSLRTHLWRARGSSAKLYRAGNYMNLNNGMGTTCQEHAATETMQIQSDLLCCVITRSVQWDHTLM